MMIKGCRQHKEKQRWFGESTRAMLAILALGLCHDVNGFSQRADVVDICIIGAGPSGIQAAYSAESKGYTVAVFEKESYVGGKTKTIEVNGAIRPYAMGAAIHLGQLGSSLTDLFKKFKVTKVVLDYSIAFLNKDGSSAKFFPPLLQFAAQAMALFSLRASLVKYINGPEGYLSDYPASLNVPMKDWLEQNNLNTLSDFYWIIMSDFGYGALEEVPAVFALVYLPVIAMVGATLFLLEEEKSTVDLYIFRELLQKMADSLSGDIYLNSEITDVDYKALGNRSEITFSVNGSPTASILCDATIVAFPPTNAAIEGFVPPDSKGLEDVINQVQTYHYFSLLFDDSEGYFADDVTFAFLMPQSDIISDPGVNGLLVKQQEFKGSFVSAYFSVPLGSNITDEQVREQSLASYSSVIGRPVDDSIIRDFNRWIYFPHASTESLENGFFQKFDYYQGHYNQYYTGGLFNFESVQTSMEHAEHIVKKFF